jgi:hypothetical protein
MPPAALLQRDDAPEAGPTAGERSALLSQIEDALKTATERERARIFTATKRLFLKYATTLDGEGLALFDDLFMRQTDGIDDDALEALSNALARLAHAPQRLMSFLANHPNIAISGPALRLSLSIDPKEVFGIASQCGQDQLLAICQRRSIDEHLSALLIDRGDRRVIDALAKNPGAKYLIDDFGAMLGRASADERARVLTRMPVAIRNAETGPAYVRCMMVDVSPGGAKLELIKPVPMPETFILEFTNVHDTRITARRIWEKGNIAGLFFTSSLCALWGATPVPLPNVRTAADLIAR